MSGKQDPENTPCSQFNINNQTSAQSLNIDQPKSMHESSPD